jgi:hypothetical protein
LNGKQAKKSRAGISLSYDDARFNVNFFTDPITHTGKAPQLRCNGDLRKQEYCGLFIRPRDADPERYLEIAINPFGFLSVGMIENKGCGGKYGLKVRHIDCKQSTIEYFCEPQQDNNNWNYNMSIPWDLLKNVFQIPGDKRPSYNSKMRNWMINMFCVRMKKNVKMCTNNSDCEFTAWSPTGKYENPDFHQCSAFREIELVE